MFASCGAENATVGGNPGEDDGGGAEIAKQDFERRLKKRRVHGLEHTIIPLVGLNRLDEGFPGAVGAQAVR
jgi:hypothetical protein